jgi:serpin B
MRKLFLIAAPLVLLAGGAFIAWRWYLQERFTPPPPWTDEMQVVADGNNRFAFDVYGKLRETEKGNLFFSPYSAHTALAMTATGARGRTREEMVKVLYLSGDESKALAAGDLGRFYAHPRKDFQLAVANTLWGQKAYPWRQEFLDIQMERFSAGFHEADFKSDPDGERQRINQWVEQQTRDKIKELLKPGIITPLTRMVLANAIYFKGEWEQKFNPQQTRDAPFTLADGSKIQVPMMHREGGFRHYVEGGTSSDRYPELQVAELPYHGGELSMVVMLPGKHDGLAALESKLAGSALHEWLRNAADAKKDTPIVIPKFHIETNAMMLKGSLQKLGMLMAFDPDQADFKGMHTGPEQLYVDFVVQKAFVDVNEEGTEAAAATAVAVRAKSATLEFRADRPFLFLIRDVKHGTILFLGRVMNPKK